VSYGRRVFAALLCVGALSLPALADSKSESLKPLSDEAQPTTAEKDESGLRAELEKEYRAALETRLAQEKASYEGSLHSLWIANSAVWGMLLLFVVMQALSARKRERELERLRNR
jgi:hypothetical protein